MAWVVMRTVRAPRETALSNPARGILANAPSDFRPAGLSASGLGQAHEEVVKLGTALSAEARPRATCAVCLVQDSAAYWAHVGDSRIYQLRQAQVAGTHPRSQPRRGIAA